MKLILFRKNVVDWAHAGDALVASAEREKTCNTNSVASQRLADNGAMSLKLLVVDISR
jgi:hypothetical protein